MQKNNEMKRDNKMKVLIKLTALLLVIILSAFFCSCQPKNNNTISYEEPEHIIWGIVRYNPYIEQINTSSEVIKYISQKFNCKIDFRYYNSFSTKSLIQLLDNETCPDILTMEGMSVEGQYLAINNFAIPANEILSPENYNLIPRTTLNLLSEYDNILYGIPGRYADKAQLENANFPKNEGVYVCKQFYDLLGRPEINNMDDLINISREFLLQYQTLTKRLVNFENYESIKQEPIPILLGSVGSGLETLKHLFGIYPVFENNGEVRVSASSPGWSNLLDWLNRLSLLNVNSMSVSDKYFNQLLNGRNLFYIGSAPGVGKTNYINNFTYELLQIKNSGKTFSVNPYGSCQTYAIKRSNIKCLKPLMNFIFSQEGNFLVKYGIEYKHWINANGSAIPLNWVIDQFETGDNQFRESTGIGQLMFLTNLKNDNVYVPDLLSTENNAFYSIVLKYNFSSYESIKLNKLNELEINLCQRMASTSPTDYPEKYSLIMAELPYVAVYERQFRIQSLKDNFLYWRQQNLYDSEY